MKVGDIGVLQKLPEDYATLNGTPAEILALNSAFYSGRPTENGTVSDYIVQTSAPIPGADPRVQWWLGIQHHEIRPLRDPDQDTQAVLELEHA